MNGLFHVKPGNSFVPNFQLTALSEVNGINRIPLYQWALVPLFKNKISFIFISSNKFVPGPL